AAGAVDLEQALDGPVPEELVEERLGARPCRDELAGPPGEPALQTVQDRVVGLLFQVQGHGVPAGLFQHASTSRAAGEQVAGDLPGLPRRGLAADETFEGLAWRMVRSTLHPRTSSATA